MTDDQPTGSCPTCRRRDPRNPQLCEVDRSKFRTWLGDLPHLVEELEAVRYDGINGKSAGGRVSGSKERQLPIRVDPLDLAAPARNVWLLGEDQVGHISVASILDFWARDWREARGGRERLPDPYVPALAAWLLRRADDAMDSHPAIDEAWHDVRRIYGALRAQLGLIEVPDYKRGVPCPACAALTLVRYEASDWVECASPGCGALLTPEQYNEHVAALAAQIRREKAA